MLRNEMKHGFAQSDWDAAKYEARAIMIGRAKARGTISYSDLVKQIKSIELDAQDIRLFHMLGEISSDEDDAGRGMLTAVVVHKEDQRPGKGFFELAKKLGRNTSDTLSCWTVELDKVYTVWSKQAPERSSEDR